MSTHTILICDDNEAVHESLRRFLREENMQVVSAYDGKTALELWKKNRIDLIILDIMLPDLSGTEICREIRKESNVPILFLSARGEEIDRVLGLELGADDYVTKPFSPREVAIRVRRILARTGVQTGEESGVKDPRLTFQELSVDPQSMEVHIAGERVEMTAKEVQLLMYLMQNAQRVLNREQILEAVWGYDYFGDTRAVDAVIKRIRRKLSRYDLHFEIQTIYSVGYRLQRREDRTL